MINMKIKLLAVSVVVLLVASACAIRLPNSVTGSGKVITESRPISGIHAVSLTGVGELFIDQTGSESLTLEADDNIMPLITTQVSNGTLIIGFKDNTIPVRTSGLKYTLTVESLDEIDLSGAGTMDARNLTADRLVIGSSGAGKITTAGKVTDQQVTLSGAGGYDGANLETENTRVQVSGVGSATVRVNKTLDAKISGIGSVEYIGNPTVTKEISGAGTVKQREP
jgi:hypothetical protein